MTLFQLNKYAYSAELEALWQSSLQPDDAIMLIEEAIMRLQSPPFLAWLESKSIPLYYLQSDAEAYGLEPQAGTPLTEIEWVETTLAADKHISW
ncbi:DsrH/TusB family sulfur metabolism protein [Marinomonas dokdonensis]|uniref:DsrH/TusB family sulfur metabolism protein n=1 Tax=Marinomonas dokdonensis TaxID=328224 RepID=UPI0040555EEC